MPVQQGVLFCACVFVVVFLSFFDLPIAVIMNIISFTMFRSSKECQVKLTLSEASWDGNQ